MSEKDDQDWIRVLAGEEAKDADMATVREARALRAAMLEYEQRDEAADFDGQRGLQQLLFRMRREQLLTREKRRWNLVIPMAIAATLALSVGIGIYMEREASTDDLTKTRGIGIAQTLQVADPAATRDALVKDLTALGAQPKVREGQGAIVIEATWPVKPGEGHAAFLERHKLTAPGEYVLEIRVVPQKP